MSKRSVADLAEIKSLIERCEKNLAGTASADKAEFLKEHIPHRIEAIFGSGTRYAKQAESIAWLAGLADPKSDMRKWLTLLSSAKEAVEQEMARDELDVIAEAPYKGYWSEPSIGDKVFIVHGHDAGTKEMVARLLEKLGLEAVILHEQAGKGRTIIEKFEDHADVGFAVVILSADDLGKAKADGDAALRSRARQNVILELGYFIGRIGRDRVCALKDESVEAPSDIAGVEYVSTDKAGAWRYKLAAELKAAGYEIDLNKVSH